MKFNTHNKMPKSETSKSVKILLGISVSMVLALLIFASIVCSLYTSNFLPAILILTPICLLISLLCITQKDMDKAYVEITDNTISVVDYYFGIQKKKTFTIQDIAFAEIIIGYSIHNCGYRYSNIGCTYIVFRDNRGKYLFKVICVPETEEFFANYIHQS